MKKALKSLLLLFSLFMSGCSGETDENIDNNPTLEPEMSTGVFRDSQVAGLV